MRFTTNGIHKALAVASLMILLGGAATIRADQAGKKALEADPRYKQLGAIIDKAKAAQHDPDPRRRPRALDILADISQIQGAFETLLQQLKAEADACRPCQPQQGKYEELAKEWGAVKNTVMDAPGGRELLRFTEALRTGNWGESAPPLTEEQLQQLDKQSVVGGVGQHCITLYSPQNRLPFLAPEEKREVERDQQKYAVFSKLWTDRMYACQGQLNAVVLYAQHRLALGRCLTSHDYDRIQHNVVGATGAQMQAQQQAFAQCMNENDVVTAACNEDLKISAWVRWRRDPLAVGVGGPVGSCLPVTVPAPRPAQDRPRAAKSSETVGLDTVRTYMADPAKVTQLEKEAGGATPASFGLDVNIPAPTPGAILGSTPANSLGVPVGAKFTLTTLEPIDLLRVDAARRYRAQLAGPAEFRGRLSLSKGVEVSLRAYRQDTGNPRIITVAIESVSAVIDSRLYPFPGSIGSPALQSANAGGGLTDGQRQTVLPAGSTLQGTVLSAVRPRPDDPADAGSPLLRAAPFPTDDPNFMHPAYGPETGASPSRPAFTLLPGGLSPPVSLPLPVVVAEPVELASGDDTLRFRAQTAAPVQYQGDVVVPAGADVFLKVLRKGQNRLFYQVALTVESVVLDGKRVPLRTSQIMRNVRMPQEGAASARPRPVRQQRLPPGAETLPAGTQLSFSIAAPGAQ